LEVRARKRLRAESLEAVRSHRFEARKGRHLMARCVSAGESEMAEREFRREGTAVRHPASRRLGASVSQLGL
jgi:hypothetical protein